MYITRTDMFQLAARTRRFGVDVQSVICTLGIDIVHFGGRTTSALSFSTANPFEQYPSVGEVDLALAPAPYCLRVDCTSRKTPSVCL